MALSTPVVGTKNERAAASTSSTPAYPAVTAGDLLLGLGVSGATAPTVFDETTSAAFTVDGQASSIGNTSAPEVYCAHAIATGSESGTQAWHHTNVITSMAIVGMSGQDASVPFDPNVNGGAPTLIDPGSASTNFVIPSVTVTTAGSTLLYIMSGNSTSITATPPAGWTELVDRTLASSRGWQVAYMTGVAAGATGTASAVWSGSNRAVGYLYVIQPATGGTAATGTATLDLVATGAAQAAAIGSAAVSLAATGAAAAPVVGTAALSLNASGAAAAPIAGTAALSLAATGTARAAGAGTAAVDLVATGAARAAAAGSAAVDLVATGSATGPGSTGTAALSLVATGSARAAATGSAAVSLVAAGTAQAGATGTGALTLAASGTAAARGAGNAALSLLGQGAAAARAIGTALLSLIATGAAQAGGGSSSPSAYAVAHLQTRRAAAGDQPRKVPADVLARKAADELPRKTLAEVRPRSIPATTRKA